MHNHKMRIVFIFLSIILCLIIALKVTAGSGDTVETEVPDIEISNDVPNITPEV